MQDERTPARPYRSLYGGGWLTPAQFLAEGMCARQARKDKTELPLKFWNEEKWKRVFLLQHRFALSLLKVYDAESVMRALRTSTGKGVYSLGAKFLDPLVRDEQRKAERQEAARAAKSVEPPVSSEPPAERPKEAEPPRPAFVRKQTNLSKLKNI